MGDWALAQAMVKRGDMTLRYWRTNGMVREIKSDNQEVT